MFYCKVKKQYCESEVIKSLSIAVPPLWFSVKQKKENHTKIHREHTEKHGEISFISGLLRSARNDDVHFISLSFYRQKHLSIFIILSFLSSKTFIIYQ